MKAPRESWLWRARPLTLAVTSAMAIAASACGAGTTEVPVTHEPVSREACEIDGISLAEIEPPNQYQNCHPSIISDELASALRLYAQSRDLEVVALVEPIVSSPADSDPTWWRFARTLLARAYLQLGREREADALFSEIVRDTDDPFRWAAAGWLCRVEPRSFGPFPRCWELGRGRAPVVQPPP